MVSETSYNSDIPFNILLQKAEACPVVLVKKFEGSERFIHKECCFCGGVINLGLHPNNYALVTHMRSSGCHKNQDKAKTITNSSHIPALFPTDNIALPMSTHMEALKAEHFKETTKQSLPIPPVVTPSSSVVINNCPGALIEYGSTMFLHYPWQLHAPECNFLSYTFAYIDPQGHFFYARSNKCMQKPSKSGAPCVPCSQVPFSRQFQDLFARASSEKPLPPSTNLQYQTYPQICSLLKDRTSQKKTLQLKQIGLNHRIQTLSGRMDDQKRLISAIAQSDDAALGRIVQTALRHGAGVQTIINRLAQAQQGLYSPHHYLPKLYDLATLIHKIGGPRLLFAVAKEMHLPSISTVNGRLNLPRLLPSVGFPLESEILANIESFFGPNAPGYGSRNTCVGLSLMIDEIAIEPRLRYSIQQDTVLGFSREDSHLTHLNEMSTCSNPVDALLEAKALLDSGKCHRATEASMVAIARFGSSDYNPAILAASGTCKTEKWPDQARWIGRALHSWEISPYGEVMYGPIWSVNSDGDAARRLALFQLCMSSKLSPDTELFRLIGHLPLFNLYCGPTQITHDGDYKHIEKRLASALRSRSGILVNGAHITPKMLVKNLRCLKDLTETQILSFFDGRDPQNVPKANTLLMNLYKASCLPVFAGMPEHKPFVLLGQLLGLFVLPFTAPSMSLSDQIASLSTCGHLLYALYSIDGPKLLPGQLFYDIQATIKNAIFCTAKTQLLGPDLPFYLLQTGTDRLESRFGTFRTTTSDRNGDILQMCERAASAQHIDEIFAAHPDWNRTPYRLSLDGKSGVDHTNPASWIGDVIVGHVDLHKCWMHGQSQAAGTLKQAGVPFEFNPLILPDTVDLMRPSGVYPGVQVDKIVPEIQPILPSELSDPNSAMTLISSRESSGFEASDGLAPNLQCQVGDDELTIEHLLPAPHESPVPQDSQSRKGWILIGNDWIHLESAVRYLLGSDGGPKSTDRLRRVCGFTRYLNPSSVPGNSILGDYFHISDLIATFLRVDNRVTIAIIHVTNIVSKDGNSLESI
ncbi:hypothetical protein RSAG8_11224, partial [Rhizoctonia solani AG-8 WAC10335]